MRRRPTGPPLETAPFSRSDAGAAAIVSRAGNAAAGLADRFAMLIERASR
jgi:hypothetical protein